MESCISRQLYRMGYAERLAIARLASASPVAGDKIQKYNSAMAVAVWRMSNGLASEKGLCVVMPEVHESDRKLTSSHADSFSNEIDCCN